MSSNAMMRKLIAPGLLLGTLGLAATPAAAVDYYMCAEATTKTMPDETDVDMWGFRLDNDANLNNGCATGTPNPVQVPGPRLTVSDTETTLAIHLRNYLPEPVSVVIPGQAMPTDVSGNLLLPVRHGSGPFQGRVRSFTQEAGTTPSTREQSYYWLNVQPGTYIYHSGTHPQLQVQMGLYGAIRRDVDTSEAYPDITYDMQRDIFYSEVDPALHSSETAANTGNYNPKYFLLQRYDTDTMVVDASIDPGTIPPVCIPTGSLEAGQSMLLRLYNAGLNQLKPMMIGSRFDVVAEGGKQYQFARNQYSVLLPPMDTRDLLWTPSQGGTFPLIERGLSLTDPGTMGTVSGGMQTCLTAGTGTNGSPTANAGVAYNGYAGIPMAFDGTGSSDPDGDPLGYSWDFDVSNGLQVDATGATPNHVYASTGSFTATLTVDDGRGGTDSDTAGVTVDPNNSPTANANGPYTGRTGFPIAFSSAGSNDPEGQALSYSWDFDDSNSSTEANPSHAYAAAGTYNDVTVTVDDGFNTPVTSASTTATVTDNGAPSASLVATNTSLGSAEVTLDACGTEPDPDGDTLTYTWHPGDGTSQTTVGDCDIMYTYAAPATFTAIVEVDDGFGGTDSATTNVTVTEGAPADTLTCKKASYQDKRDKLSVEVKTTDKTGLRTMTAVMDVDNDATFETLLGILPVKNVDVYKKNFQPFEGPNPTAISVVKVTSDLGGSCQRNVKVD